MAVHDRGPGHRVADQFGVWALKKSGTAWQIRIDYGKATVDANPARITQGAISWFDPKDFGNYTLDRKSGDLTTSVASSTGGYFRRARCNLETTR